MPDNHTTNALGSDMSFPHAYGELVNQDGVIQAVDSPRGMGFDPNPQQKIFLSSVIGRGPILSWGKQGRRDDSVSMNGYAAQYSFLGQLGNICCNREPRHRVGLELLVFNIARGSRSSRPRHGGILNSDRGSIVARYMPQFSFPIATLVLFFC